MGYIVELHEAIQSPHLAEVQYNRYIWITAGYESAADISMGKEKKKGEVTFSSLLLLSTIAIYRYQEEIRVKQHLE